MSRIFATFAGYFCTGMSDAIYHLIVIAFAVAGVARGYRGGLTRQAASVVGLAFGIVCAHLFSTPVADWLFGLWPHMESRLGGIYFVEMLSSSAVFLAVYYLMALFNVLLRSALSLFSSGMLNSLMGAAYGLARYMFFVSIAFNLLVGFNPRSRLLKFAVDNDANVVSVVTEMAPAAFGLPGPDELFFEKQLDDARYISLNSTTAENVIELYRNYDIC